MSFKLEETTIRDIHEGYLSGQLTCVRLVQAYLDRISAYDQSGPAVNAFVKLNPAALEEAAALDAHYSASGALLGPLHGIPVAVKDQAETKGIETRFGCEALSGYVPEQDATIVAKMKAAGAIILGKTAMPDFATSWFGYSSVNGETKNLMISTVIQAARVPAPELRSRLTLPRSESAKTPAARSGCRRASTTWSACA